MSGPKEYDKVGVDLKKKRAKDWYASMFGEEIESNVEEQDYTPYAEESEGEFGPPIKYKVEETTTIKQLCDQFGVDVDEVWKMNSHQFGIETQSGEPVDYVIEAGTELMLPGNAVGVLEVDQVHVDADAPDVNLTPPSPGQHIPKPFPDPDFMHEQDDPVHIDPKVHPDNGDEPGILKDIISHKIMDRTLPKSGSVDVKIKGKGIIRDLRDKKAAKLLQDSMIQFDSEYSDKTKPVLLKIAQDDIKKKYWDYFTTYLYETYSIGKETENGTLRPYTYEERGEIDQGNADYFIVYGPPINEPAPDPVTPPANNITPVTGEDPNKQVVHWETIREETSADAPVRTSRYSGTKRPDILWDKELTPLQAKDYRFDEAYMLIKIANPQLSKKTGRQFTRRALADGWDIDNDPVPVFTDLIDEDISENGYHIIEVDDFDRAFAYANKKKKEGDMSYDTFVWRRKVSGDTEEHGTDYAPPNCWANYTQNYESGVIVNFDELGAFAGFEGIKLVRKIKLKKAYSDKLLDPNFVALVYMIQQKLWPEAENAHLRTGIWDDATKAKYSTYEADQQKKIDDAKAKKDAEDKKWAEVGEDLGNGFRKYIRDQRTLTIETAKLKEVQDACARDDSSADEVLEDYTPGKQQWKEDLAYMLTAAEREAIIKAYSEEFDADEEEEEVINLVLRNTPVSQYPAMKLTLEKYERDEDMKDWFDTEAEIAEYNTAREKIMGVVDTLGVAETYEYVDTDDDAEDEAEDLTAMLARLSAGQVKLFDWYHRQMYLDTFLGEEEPTDPENWFYFDKLFINMPDHQIGDLQKELQADNYIKAARLADRVARNTTEYQQQQVNTYLDIWYADNQFVYEKLAWIADHTSDTFDGFERDKNFLAGMPNVVYEKLTDQQRVNIFRYVVDYSTTTELNSVILKKVIGTVGTGIVDQAEKDARRQEFFDVVGGTEFVNEDTIEDEDQRNEVIRLMNDMDYLGRKHRVNETVDDSRYAGGIFVDVDADDELAELGDEDLAYLELWQRKGMIENLVGRNSFESFFTRVGDQDENTLIRLIYTCPDSDMPELLAWIGSESGSMLSTIQTAMSQENYNKLHQGFHDKKFESVENEQDADKKAQEEEKMQTMEQTGQDTSSGSIPWDPYSKVGLLFFSSGIDYDVWWTEDGKVAIEYQTMNWADMYIGTRWIEGYKDKPTPGPFDPWEWVAVYSKEEDTSMGLAEGEVRLMPAINLFNFEQVQDDALFWETVDIVSLMVGYGEYKMAAGFIKRLVAFMDVFLSAGNIITRTFGDRMPDGWVTNWQALSAEIATYQFIYLGTTLLLRNKLKALQTQLDNVTNLTLRERTGLQNMLDMDEEMLNKVDEISASTDKAALQKELNELDLSKSSLDPDGYTSLRKLYTDRIDMIEKEAVFKNSPDNQVTNTDAPNVTNKVPGVVNDVPKNEVPKQTFKHSQLVTNEGAVTLEKVEIEYDGSMMTFTKKPGGSWVFEPTNVSKADGVTKNFEDALNAKNGVDDVATKAGEGKLDYVANPKLAIQAAEVDSAFINGWTRKKILNLPKKSRPLPEDCFSSEYLSKHLEKFEDGAVRFTSRSEFVKRGTLGPDGGFVLPKSELDMLLTETKGDLRALEKKLGFDEGYLSSDDVMIVTMERSNCQGLRMPSGNEGGANPHWIPGGYTSGGIPEGVMDFSKKPPFTEINLK